MFAVTVILVVSIGIFITALTVRPKENKMEMEKRDFNQKLLFIAVKWCEKYCKESGNSFDSKRAIDMILSEIGYDVDDDTLDIITDVYNEAK